MCRADSGSARVSGIGHGCARRDIQKVVDVWFDVIDFIAKHEDEAIAIMAQRRRAKARRLQKVSARNKVL
jgi:hypothetical protein